MSLPVRILDAVPGRVASQFKSSGVAAWLARPLVNRLLPSQEQVVCVRSGPARGIKLPINPTSEKYYWTGLYERRVQETFVELVRPGWLVWDVGAHIGFFSLLAARLAGPSGRIHAFEPMPINRRRLTCSVELGGLDNVEIHGVAFAARPGEQVLRAHEATTMWHLAEDSKDLDGVLVTCTTLDLMAEALGDPDLIKIDVEGAELDVLSGGQAVFERARPIVVLELDEGHRVEHAEEHLRSYRFEQIGDRQWVAKP